MFSPRLAKIGLSAIVDDPRRKKVCVLADNYRRDWGWNIGVTVGAPNNMRIAANKCVIGAGPGPRQGGANLAEIFKGAGKPTNNLLTISQKAVSNYALGIPGRNQWDIISWCGIFVLFSYKKAGLQLSNWPLKHKQTAGAGQTFEFMPVTKREDVKRGDLAIIHWNAENHHCLIIGVEGDVLTTIEGNVTDTFGNYKFQTIVRRKSRTISGILKDKHSGFATPFGGPWKK